MARNTLVELEGANSRVSSSVHREANADGPSVQGFSPALLPQRWIALADGRTVGFAADKCRVLRDAPQESLAKVKIEQRGKALRWDELDEDLTVEGILAGRWQV